MRERKIKISDAYNNYFTFLLDFLEIFRHVIPFFLFFSRFVQTHERVGNKTTERNWASLSLFLLLFPQSLSSSLSYLFQKRENKRVPFLSLSLSLTESHSNSDVYDTEGWERLPLSAYDTLYKFKTSRRCQAHDRHMDHSAAHEYKSNY